MRYKTFNKMVVALLTITMVISSSLVSFANTGTNQDHVAAEETTSAISEDGS